MKKLLIALTLTLGFAAFAPQAQAGQYAKVWTKGGVAYVHKSSLYGNAYCAPVRRQQVYGYRQPACQPRYDQRAYYQTRYNDDYGYGYRQPARCDTSRSRVTFAFGY